MAKHFTDILQTPDAAEWMTFPGGELQGKRPKRLCQSCSDRLEGKGQRQSRPALCFQCYRLELDREKALKAAGELDTASDARFQGVLPLEPVNTGRLSMLKVERSAARSVTGAGTGQFVDRRRQAQIVARHALQAIAAGVHLKQAPAGTRERLMAIGVHAAELQLPEAWLPFVVAR